MLTNFTGMPFTIFVFSYGIGEYR